MLGRGTGRRAARGCRGNDGSPSSPHATSSPSRTSPSGSRPRLDWVDFGDLERTYRDSGRRLIGTWHSHESYQGARAEPSQADHEAWADGLLHSRDDFHIGLIVHPSGPPERAEAWLWPHWSAWVARHDGDGATVIEPAEIERVGSRW